MKTDDRLPPDFYSTGKWWPRPVVVVVLAFFGTMVVYYVLQIFNLVAPELAAQFKALLQSEWLDVPFKIMMPWTIENCIGTWLTLSAIVASMSFSRRLAFLLFADFDSETLQAISRNTGLLTWHLPETGEVPEVWRQLLDWVRRDCGDGRWSAKWLTNGKPDTKSHTMLPFAWTLLTGPNGVGKSQLAMELARHIARRDLFGDHPDQPRPLGVSFSLYRQRLCLWWNRVAWWRACTDPNWDCGFIVKNAAKLDVLSTWRPRMPTLLLLDDPHIGMTRDVIERLSSQQAHYVWPVRLLIIDQFIPSDAPLEWQADGKHWYHEGSPEHIFEGFALNKVCFTVSDLRAIIAGGYWGLDSTRKLILLDCSAIPALTRQVTDDKLEQLIDALEGNPLLIAMAVLWFAADERRHIHQLLSAESLSDEEERLFPKTSTAAHAASLKAKVAHRLIRERLEEVYIDFKRREKEYGFDSRHGLLNALVCATLTQGLPVSRARDLFQVTLDQQQWHRLFPEHSEHVENIPERRPWTIGSVFINKVRSDCYAHDPEGFRRLLELAFFESPGAVLKLLRRKDSLVRELAEVIANLPAAPDSQTQLEQLLAFSEGCLYGHPQLLAQTLQRLQTLNEDQLNAFLDALTQRQLHLKPHPDWSVALTLFCLAWQRRLTLAPNANDLDMVALLDWLEQNLPKLVLPQQNLALLTALTDAWQALWAALFTRIAQLTDVEQQFSLLLAVVSTELLGSTNLALEFSHDIRMALEVCLQDRPAPDTCLPWFVLLYHCNELCELKEIAALEQVVQVLQEECPTSDAKPAVLIKGYAMLSLVRSYALQLDSEKARQLATQIQAMTSTFQDNSEIQALCAKAWRDVAFAYSQTPALRGLTVEIAEKIDDIAEPLPEHPQLQKERAEAWRYVAFAYSETPMLRDRTAEIAKKVDNIAEPFQEHAGIQEARATAWCHVAFAYSQTPTLRDRTVEIAKKVDAIAELFSEFPRIQEARAKAWRDVTFAYSETAALRERTAEIAKKVDAVAEPFPEQPGIQEARALAWRDVAFAYSETPALRDRTAEIAAKVDEIIESEPFREQPGIQEARAWAWSDVASAYSQTPALRDRTAEIAKKVDEIAEPEPFREHAVIQAARATAWCHVAFAYSETPALRERTAEIAEKVDAIGASESFRKHAAIQEVRAWAWSYVAFAYSAIPALRERTAEIAKKVDEIAEPEPFREQLRIQEARAWAWGHVAFAYSETSALRERTAEIAEKVDAIAMPEPFREHAGFQEARAKAWCHVAFAYSQTPMLRGRTAEIAKKVGAIAALFSNHPGIQEAHDKALRYVADALGSLE